MAAQRSLSTKAKKSPSTRASAAVKKPVKKASPAKTVAAVKAAPPAKKLKPKAKPVANNKPIAVAKKAVETKPAKLAAPMNKTDLAHFRDLLLERRRELLGDVGTMESEAFKSGSNLSNMPIHMADVGTDNFEQEFTLGLIESERKTLREIHEALTRIENGTYGICLGTGKSIPKVRLEAVPWAKYTIEYSRDLESGVIRSDSSSGSDDDSGDDDDD